MKTPMKCLAMVALSAVFTVGMLSISLAEGTGYRMTTADMQAESLRTVEAEQMLVRYQSEPEWRETINADSMKSEKVADEMSYPSAIEAYWSHSLRSTGWL